MSKPILLLFGAGSRVGKGLTDGFVNAGYRVATVNRSAPEQPTTSASGQVLSIRADISQPAQIPPVFEQVRNTWGGAPSVVVWNAASFSVVPDQSNIFTLGLDAINHDMALMITSPFVAAREAVEGWKTDNLPGRFIMTGNCLPRSILPLPNLTTSGIGKAGGAYWVGQADALYKSKGWRYVQFLSEYDNCRCADTLPDSSSPMSVTPMVNPRGTR